MREVVEKLVQKVCIKDLDVNKLYAFSHQFTIQGKSIYKLQHVDNTWCFVDIDGSKDCVYTDVEMELCVKKTIKYETVYEFENQKEFLEWALKELNK